MSVRAIRGRYMVDIRHMGTRYRKMCPSNQHHDAMKYELLLRSELATHGDLDHMYFRKPRPSLSLADFVPRWLREYVKVNNRPRVYDSTYGSLYRNILPVVGTRPLALLLAGELVEGSPAGIAHGA